MSPSPSPTTSREGPTPRGRQALLFAALGEETRLHLVSRLSVEGPLSITQLSATSGVTRQAVTKHLRVLAGAGLARSTHVGRETIWAFEPTPLTAARQYLGEISARWDEALQRLKAMVEEDAEDLR
jgi:DNA-binding transcriptional ArsR family regulator